MSMKIARFVGAGVIAASLFLAGTAQAQDAPATYVSPDEELAGDEPAPDAPRRRARGERPRMEVRPYLELNAGVSADLSGDEEVLTYTSAAVGVDARVATRRVTAQGSYRYERRIDVSGDSAEDDVHSGVAMVHVEAAPGLSLDAGALATRASGPGRSSSTVTDFDATTQVYSAYVGPTLNRRVGDLTVGAAYRLGYVRVDHDDDLAGVPGGRGFDDAVAHSASASIGMGPGRLPFGWTVGAGYVREESGEFENRFEGMFVRGDVVVPVGPTLALTAGVGYENIDSSQLDVLRDAGGVPILVGGRPVADPTRPRLNAFDRSGLIYDAGVIWRPTPRTELQARGGRRYGGTTFTGSLRHRFNGSYGLNASVYDTVGAAANTIISNVSQLPADFTANRNPLTGAFDGCVFGQDPGTGICFDQALQTLSSGTFRARGVNLVFSGNRGPWNFGLGAGYSHRRFFEFESNNLSSLDPHVDQSFSLNAGLSRRLSRYSGMSLDASASWYDSDRLGFDPVFGTGITGSYYRTLMRRLQFHSALGLYHTDGLIDRTVASALVGLRYTF